MGGLQATNLAHELAKRHTHTHTHTHVYINIYKYICVGNSACSLSLSSAIISLCLRSPDTFLFLPPLTGHRTEPHCIKEVIPYFIAKVTTDIGEQGPIRSI